MTLEHALNEAEALLVERLGAVSLAKTRATLRRKLQLAT